VEFVQQVRESEQPNAVVNLSLDLTQTDAEGNVTTRYELTPKERAAIEYARQHNVMIVVAAGNDGGVMSALGQASQEFDNIITVGAAERVNDEIADANAHDRAAYSSYGRGLDVLARGGTNDNPELSLTGDGVGTMAGTSVATAKVTGAISQVWAANPELSYRQVIQLVKDTATDLGVAGFDNETGAGLLNRTAAVLLAKATEPELHFAPSSLIPDSWSGEGKVTPGERAAATPFKGKYYDWKSYTIQAGDTLSEIALRTMGHGTAPYYNFIAQKNGIANPNFIITGDTIVVPYEVSPPSNNSGGSNNSGNSGNSGSSVSNPILSRQGVGYFNARPQYYTSGNIFAQSMYGSSLVGSRGYTEGNCTWYAHGRLLELGGNKAALQSMRGNANEWHTQISNGTQIASSPRPGDIAQWSNGGNHVAVVERVNSDGTITISESHYKTNWDGGGAGTLHNVRKISANAPDRFIRVPGVQVESGGSSSGDSAANTFTGRVIATVGANLRSGPNTGHSIVGSADYGDTLTFDKAVSGEFISYPSLGTQSDQWYRITGTNQWISAALIHGSPQSSVNDPSAKPGEQMQYIVKPGDTLWGIAQQFLGDGSRWRELQKADGSTFTDADARSLRVGQSVYIPVSYESGTGQPIENNPPSSDPDSESGINWVDFTGWVGPSQGVNLRHSPRHEDRSNRNEPYGKKLEFDGWKHGETVTDIWLGTPDSRWFKVKGTNYWVPSAYIWGNPSDSDNNQTGSGSIKILRKEPMEDAYGSLTDLTNFRSYPQISSGTYRDQLSAGTQFEILEKVYTNNTNPDYDIWYKVRLNDGREGYICKLYFDFVTPHNPVLFPPPKTERFYDGREAVNSKAINDLKEARDDDWYDERNPSFLQKSLLGNAWLAHKALQKTWEGLGWDDAAKLLGKYLDSNNGGVVKIDLDEAIRESSKMRSELLESFNIREVMNAVQDGYTSGIFGNDWDTAGSSDLAPDQNWWQALGGFSKRYEGSFEKNDDGSITIKLKFHVRDVYDFVEPRWDLTQSHALHTHGLARAFLTKGESREYTWKYRNLVGMLAEQPSEFAGTVPPGTMTLVR
jgi:surface antigen